MPRVLAVLVFTVSWFQTADAATEKARDETEVGKYGWCGRRLLSIYIERGFAFLLMIMRQRLRGRPYHGFGARPQFSGFDLRMLRIPRAFGGIQKGKVERIERLTPSLPHLPPPKNRPSGP